MGNCGILQMTALELVHLMGCKTPWGKVVAIGLTGGERYCWMINKWGSVAMIPASEVVRYCQ